MIKSQHVLTVIRNPGIQLLICTLFGSQYPGKNNEKKLECVKWRKYQIFTRAERGQDIELDSWPKSKPTLKMRVNDPVMTKSRPPPWCPWCQDPLLTPPRPWPPVGTRLSLSSRWAQSVKVSGAVSFATMIVLPCFLSCFGEQIPKV